MPYFILYFFVIIFSVLFNAGLRRRGFGSLGDYGSTAQSDLFSWGTSQIQKRNRRIEALKTAQNYLKPYEKIFGTLTLSNKFCSLNINKTSDTIVCISKEYDAFGKCMMLTAKSFSPMDIDEYFDMMCNIFGYNTKYTDVYNSLRANAIINEMVYSSRPVEDKLSPARNIMMNKQSTAAQRLTDVNNASEAELTALPGISIIIAKKIIKFRETQRPFRSVDDFIQTMKVKEHFAKHLKQQICVNKINIRKVKKAKAERILDL